MISMGKTKMPTERLCFSGILLTAYGFFAALAIAACSHNAKKFNTADAVKVEESECKTGEQEDAEEEATPPANPLAVNCGRGKHCVPFLRFSGAISDASVSQTIAWLTAAQAANPEAIVLELDTSGGSVDAGFRLIRAIETSEVPVVCVVDYKAMSAGFAVLQACSARFATPRAKLLTHQPYTTATSGGTLTDLGNAMNSLRVTAHVHAVHCASRLKITFEEYNRRVANNVDWVMDASEALQVGAIDAIAPSTATVVMALRTNGVK